MVVADDGHPNLATSAHAVANTDQYVHRHTGKHTKSLAGRTMGDVSTGSISVYVDPWPVR